MEFKPGDMVRHKATLKRCVVKKIDPDGSVWVTTQDDEVKKYSPEEFEPYEPPSTKSINIVE